MSKVVERGLWILPRSLFDAVKFRVQFLVGKAELPHCFSRFRLGLLEPFPLCAAFPRSEYYGSSDFSEPSQHPCVVKLGFRYLLLTGCSLEGSSSRSLLLTHTTSSHMPGSWTPPGLSFLALSVSSDVGFHVINRVALTGIHYISGLDHFTPLKAFRPV